MAPTGIVNENLMDNDHNKANPLLPHTHHINHGYDHVPAVYNTDVSPLQALCPISPPRSVVV